MDTHAKKLHSNKILNSVFHFFIEEFDILLIISFAAFLAYVFFNLSKSAEEDLAKEIAQLSLQVGSFYEKPSTNTQSQLQNLLFVNVPRLEELSYRKEWYRHISLAFSVAIGLILGVDIHMRRRVNRDIQQYRDSLGEDVLSAVSKRLVPPSISKEIDGVLKEDVAKENCNYTFTLFAMEGLPPDLIVVRREVRYELSNLVGEDNMPHSIQTFINPTLGRFTLNQGDTRIKLPRHTRLLIDENEIQPIENILKNDGLDLQYKVQLPKGKDRKVRVYQQCEEVKRSSDRAYYTQLVPVCDLSIHVKNELKKKIKFEVVLQHPKFRELKKLPDESYEFKGGLLPGQGFYILWELES